MNIHARNSLLLGMLVVLVNSLTLSGLVRADDTEIFFNSPASTSTGKRPKVMIVFDDSGSMGTLVTTREDYDPTRMDYSGGISSSNWDRVYWSTTGEPPPASSNQWFEGDKNRCESSYDSLDTQGFFATKARRWKASGTETTCVPNACPSGYFGFGGICIRFFPFSIIPRPQTCTTGDVPGEWRSLSTSFRDPPHVDCEVDVTNAEPGNGPSVADGYPKDDVEDADVYSAATPADSDVDWGGTAYTLYTGHYVNYWHDTSLTTSKSRLLIAQEVISNLVSANTGLDFGLATFNYNDGDGPTNHNGGRVIQRIIDNMTTTDRDNLVLDINSLTASGSTPLCESYYEVFRYVTGDTVLYGDDRDTFGTPDRDRPPRDTGAESSGSYNAPTFECGPIYLILMTDGLPTYDTRANAAIKMLPGISSCDDWDDDFGGTSENCLPELSNYMYTTDLDGDASNGDQIAVTYTIGFDISQPLLQAAATFDDGYFEANSAETLTAAFAKIVTSILTIESTFTSPAVAVDTFTRTESRDDVFYAMFEPDNRQDWPGNVKKLKLKLISGDLVLVDKSDVPAIDPDTGYIKDDADTFWSNDDGGTVQAGGVGARLAARDPATRNIVSNTGSGGALQPFNSTNMVYTAFPLLTSSADLFTFFGVPDQSTLDLVLAWGRGFEIESGTALTTPREWIMGDPLHSQPKIINYGALGSFSLTDPDLRILIGTNSGFLHMFGSDDGEEDWAFFPKELGPVLNKRRINNLSPMHEYGVDLTVSVFTDDVNTDGTIDDADGDKAWIYSGLRRGGQVLYSLDVSSPSSPAFKWLQTPLVTGVEELGQTWSEPVITYIPGYVNTSTGKPKPVVIIGAGYDTNKDGSGVGTSDSSGRGVFIFDADTGALVRSITPATRTAKNLSVPISDSVPAQVAVLDSNADQLTDRIYFADTGGNVWRIDMNLGLQDNFSGGETWYATKLAELGHASTSSADRRFFNRPDIVRTRDVDGNPVDVLLIGSGDRTNPLADDVNNFFYLLRDQQVIPYVSAPPSISECTGTPPSTDFRCTLPIVQGDLYDYSTSALVSGSEAQQLAEREDLANSPGWKFPLTGLGEKSLSDSVTIQGSVIFTTYTPPGVVTGSTSCEPVLGDGRLYKVVIAPGAVGSITEDELIIEADLGPIIPDTPSVVIPGPGEAPRVLVPPGAPPGDPNDPGCIGGVCFDDEFERMRGPHANFWYREDY